jgi:hypothetical protein
MPSLRELTTTFGHGRQIRRITSPEQLDGSPRRYDGDRVMLAAGTGDTPRRKPMQQAAREIARLPRGCRATRSRFPGQSSVCVAQPRAIG